MTIYIVQWTEENGDRTNKRFASSAYGPAKAKWKEINGQDASALMSIGEEEEALTKHVLSGQKEVIDLINSLK